MNQSSSSVVDSEGSNALHITCARGHMGCVAQLISSPYAHKNDLVNSVDRVLLDFLN